MSETTVTPKTPNDGEAVRCSALDDALNLAAEMLNSPAMPSSFIEDWNLPKSTPRKVCRKIIEAADRADAQCKQWAMRLRIIYDALRKSHQAAPGAPAAPLPRWELGAVPF